MGVWFAVSQDGATVKFTVSGDSMSMSVAMTLLTMMMQASAECVRDPKKKFFVPGCGMFSRENYAELAGAFAEEWRANGVKTCVKAGRSA